MFAPPHHYPVPLPFQCSRAFKAQSNLGWELLEIPKLENIIRLELPSLGICQEGTWRIRRCSIARLTLKDFICHRLSTLSLNPQKQYCVDLRTLPYSWEKHTQGSLWVQSHLCDNGGMGRCICEYVMEFSRPASEKVDQGYLCSSGVQGKFLGSREIFLCVCSAPKCGRKSVFGSSVPSTTSCGYQLSGSGPFSPPT